MKKTKTKIFNCCMVVKISKNKAHLHCYLSFAIAGDGVCGRPKFVLNVVRIKIICEADSGHS